MVLRAFINLIENTQIPIDGLKLWTDYGEIMGLWKVILF